MRDNKLQTFLTRSAMIEAKLLKVYNPENRPKTPLVFWGASLICYFMASIIGAAIWLIAGATETSAVLILPLAFLVDVVRWAFAPELRKTPYERQMSFQRALEDPAYSLQCRMKFNRRTAMIYWIWWMYTFAMFFLHIFVNIPVQGIVWFSAEFYPFIRNQNVILQTLGLPSRTAFVLEFFSVTWLFMVVAVILEISGGAFYFFHRPIRGIVTGKKILEKTSKSGLFRVPLALFCFIVTYCMLGFTELNKVGVTRAGTPMGAGHPVSDFTFVYIVLINGVALLSAAGCIRALYGYLLLLTSMVFPPDSLRLSSPIGHSSIVKARE